MLLTRIKNHIKNIAKARREASGPGPMEIEASDWECWGRGSWRSSIGSEERESWNGEDRSDCEGSDIQLVGKGGKKGSKGFQGRCFVCSEFGRTQWECGKKRTAARRTARPGPRASGLMPTTKGMARTNGMGRHQARTTRTAKDTARSSTGRSPASGSGATPKGTARGSTIGGVGGPVMQKACFGCGSTELLMRDCPKNQVRVQNVEA